MIIYYIMCSVWYDQIPEHQQRQPARLLQPPERQDPHKKSFPLFHIVFHIVFHTPSPKEPYNLYYTALFSGKTPQNIIHTLRRYILYIITEKAILHTIYSGYCYGEGWGYLSNSHPVNNLQIDCGSSTHPTTKNTFISYTTLSLFPYHKNFTPQTYRVLPSLFNFTLFFKIHI